MLVRTAEEFRNRILEELNMQIKDRGIHFRHYTSLHGDAYRLYERKGCYEFGIADYTIPHNFQLAFSNSERMIRFGIVYMGTTTFKLENQEISSFSPSSFLVVEDHISGKQAWRKGQHFHGIEVTIFEQYFNQIVTTITGSSFDFSLLDVNYTYHYLPLDMIQGLQSMQALSDTKELNAIYLESKILEFIAILYNEIHQKDGEAFMNQSEHEEVKVGNRILRLSPTDISSIQKAHRILSENIMSPPTIDSLSKMVLMNSQKLKAGFVHKYHMTIGEYTTSLRMSAAAILLCTSTKHIHDIAYEVGYAHSANFIKMFKQHYGKTPLQYRNENR